MDTTIPNSVSDFDVEDSPTFMDTAFALLPFSGIGAFIGLFVWFAIGENTFIMLLLFGMLSLGGLAVNGLRIRGRIPLVLIAIILGALAALGSSLLGVRLDVGGRKESLDTDVRTDGVLSEQEQASLLRDLSKVHTMKGLDAFVEHYREMVSSPNGKAKQRLYYSHLYEQNQAASLTRLRSTDPAVVVEALQNAPDITFRPECAAIEKEVLDTISVLRTSPDTRIRYATAQYMANHKLAPTPSR